MKPLAEGFRVYSRNAPARELRPPKSSLPKRSAEGRTTSEVGAHAWICLAVLVALCAVFLLIAVVS